MGDVREIPSAPVLPAQIGLSPEETEHLVRVDGATTPDGVASAADLDRLQTERPAALAAADFVTDRLRVLREAGSAGVNLRRGAAPGRVDRVFPGGTATLVGVLEQASPSLGLPGGLASLPAQRLRLEAPVIVGNLTRDPIFARVFLDPAVAMTLAPGTRVAVTGEVELFFLTLEQGGSLGPFARFKSGAGVAPVE